MEKEKRIIQLKNMIAMRLKMNKKFGSFCSQEEIDELQKELDQLKGGTKRWKMKTTIQ